MDYSLQRKEAAKILNVSTRTLDRYIHKGKLSHKKDGNIVLLNAEEVKAMAHKRNTINHATESVVVDVDKKNNSDKQLSSGIQYVDIDKKIERFFEIFEQKEKTINNKDKMIFMLQQRIGELETKIKSMVALPEYTQEKQSILLEKQKLQDTIEKLQGNIQTEKTKSFIMIGLILIIVLIVLAITILG